MAADFEELSFKIIYSMMLALYGTFVNPYCNRKSELYVMLYSSIKEQEEDNSRKEKKAKSFNGKRKQRMLGIEMSNPQKRVKTVDS